MTQTQTQTTAPAGFYGPDSVHAEPAAPEMEPCQEALDALMASIATAPIRPLPEPEILVPFSPPTDRRRGSPQPFHQPPPARAARRGADTEQPTPSGHAQGLPP